MVSVEGGSRVILGIDHQGVGRNLRPDCPLQRIGEQRTVESLPSEGFIDRQAPHTNGRYGRVAGQLLADARGRLASSRLADARV